MGEEIHTPMWYPPGADAHAELRSNGADRVTVFAEEFDNNFYVPSRIANVNSELIEAVNDFHFAMMNDEQRNQFYWDSLKRVVSSDSIVVEIGTGSGLLAIMCAKLGAKHVSAIEANNSLATLARANIKKNKVEDKITVINKMSTDVQAKDLPFGKADILVSEILGTLLLSESALEYTEDARKRLLKPNAHIIPYAGAQMITLVNCPRLDQITSCTGWGEIDLSRINALRDTSSLLFTKQLGCRFNSMKYTNCTARLTILECNFAKDENKPPPNERRFRCKVERTGVIHAAIWSWEVYSDPSKAYTMTTHAEDTKDNFPRDMQWGQGLQLVDDHIASEKQYSENVESGGDGCSSSVPLHVTEGEIIEIVVTYAEDGVLMQCLVERVNGDDIAKGFQNLIMKDDKQ
eukprot:g2758.t1